MSQDGIEGSIAVVTGAGQGIGHAVAVALSAAGAVVATVDRETAHLADTASAVRAAGGKVGEYGCDVRDADAVERVVDAVERDLGPVAHTVNVAGVLRSGPVVTTEDPDWAELLAVNTTGVFHVSRAVARRMIPRGRGTITTISSNAATTPRADMAGYAASKAAATAFTKSLALELAPHGIRCNVVSPGSTDTPMQRGMWNTDPGHAAARVIAGTPEKFRTGIPLGRLADPGDIAAAVTFLASDAARHITLHDLRVDGGATPGG